MIAAGEVIERPASVVKELVENAIDAQAGSIVVDIKGNGCDLVRVTDDGAGMTPEELDKAILRHATSKIGSAEDIFAIKTLGFRGEALPSIAAVSRTTIASRPRSTDTGAALVIEAGVVTRRCLKGMPPGTTAEVADLFFNTPARRKFLKTTATEQRSIIDVIARYALAYPKLAFQLGIDGRTVIDAPGNSSHEERARSLIGKSSADRMATFSRDTDMLRVFGLLGRIQDARKNRSGMYVFVNGRSVKDGMITAAIMGGYAGVLVKGSYPVAVVFIEVDPREVDVNVHPTKAEVRFRNPAAVFGILSSVIKEAVSSSMHMNASSSPGEDAWLTGRGIPQAGRLAEAALPPHLHPYAGQRQGEDGPTRPRGRPVDAAETLPLFGAERDGAGHAFSYAGLTILGSFRNAYLVLSDTDSLYILDQHAAHERVTYERLRRAYHSGRIPSQSLVSPRVVELTPGDFAAFLDARDLIESLGFSCDPFGERTVLVRAVPQEVTGSDVEGVILDAIHAPTEGYGQDTAGGRKIDAILAALACRSSVRIGVSLGREEIERLLLDLDRLGSPATCPHGRPLYKRITLGDIEKWLKRKP